MNVDRSMNLTGTAERLRDQEARDIITRELQKNVMVLAGAGAGKTHALIERMVAAIRTGAARIDRMAAITFTRKAAGEMRGRFSQRLRKEAAGTLSEIEQFRIDSAIAAVDQCFIGTIHSFCGRLLRERPLEAGLAPDFLELEERDETILRRQVWDEFVQARYLEDDGRLIELEEHGITTEDLYTFFGRRCVDADLPLKEATTSRPDLLSFVAHVEEFMTNVSSFVPARPEKLDGLMLALRRARHMLDNHGVRTDRDAALLMAQFEGSFRITLKNWTDKASAKRIQKEILPHFQTSVVEPALRRWRECAYRLATQFVDEAVRTYDQKRRETAKVTFQDLLVRTDALLRENSSVRRYFQRRFETILVDEFQDTDPIQAQILFYLTGLDVNEKDWRKLSPRPGSLFLVGDDKQSIYRFRRADVQTFRFVSERITESGGHVVNLNTSFRSLGNLCRWISASFPSVFSRETDPYQATFQPLFEYRPSGADAHCVRKISVPKVDKNKRSAIAAHDAHRIAEFISAAIRGETPLNTSDPDGPLSEKASAGDFLVLTRTTGQLAVYAQALESAGIPFDIIGGGRLGDSDEVRAVVTMLECIIEPDNPLPFVAYLRGPLVGLSDGDLYEFKTGGGRFSMDTTIPDGLDAELASRVHQAVEQLKTASDDLMTFSPGAAVERMVERLGLLAFSAGHPDGRGSSRAGNLMRLLAIVRRLSARGAHWGGVVADLRDLVSAHDYKIEETTLEMGRGDVVRIMNVHQAKGLQAKVVFLADPADRSYTKEPRSHVSRADGRTYLSMVISKPKGDYHHDIVAQPEGWDEDRAEEEQFASAEEGRLLYVAATRARNLLVVSEYGAKADSGPWSPLYPFLQGVPELPTYQGGEVNGKVRSKSRFADMSAGAGIRLARFPQATYSVRSVSGRAADDDGGYIVREHRGKEYGILVHKLLEEAVRGCLPQPVNAHIHKRVRDAGLAEQLGHDAIAALQRFKMSTLWHDLTRARKVFTEVPVGISLTRESVDEVARGIIDLVYLDESGWHVIDYKTDAASSESEIDRLRRMYTPQIQDYARFWTDVTGEKADYALWFVHGPTRALQSTLF